jgi:hypothetical protein
MNFEDWLLDVAECHPNPRGARIKEVQRQVRLWAELEYAPFAPDCLHAVVRELGNRRAEPVTAWIFIQVWGEFEVWRARSLVSRTQAPGQVPRRIGRRRTA